MIFAIIKFILNMVSYVSDWWYGRTDSTANKTEFNLEELAGGSDNVIVGLLKSIDMIHSTTLNHISQIKQFIDNAEECHVSGIKLSVNCLKHAESSLWHNRNLFFTSLESLKHNLQTTKSSICDKMSHTFDYIDNSYPDDNDTVDNDDTVDERMDTKSQEIKLLQKRVEKLEELIKGVVSPTINVQMYCPQESTVVTNAAEKLQKQLEKVDKMMQFASCLSPESAQPNVPLLILCMNSSRLGTDALGSIKGISDLKRTALVVVQYKELHALSSSTSKQILIEPEFKKLGGIFDIAYTKDQGLYDCELNTQAVTDIISFIKQL